MGQAVSLDERSPQPGIGASRMLPDHIHRHAQELKQVAALSYNHFLATVQELNKITSRFSDINGKTLVFAVKKGTDRTFLWRGTVRIKCHKVNGSSGCIESSRQLNMKQYLHLYNEIKRQASTTNLSTNLTAHDRESPLTASLIMNEIECGMVGAGEAGGDECCICMDRQAEVILTCCHSYCEHCIDTWNVRHKTCPICRAKMNVRDDTWVLTERPDVGEMALETTEYLMGLSERTGVRTRTERQHLPASTSADSESFTEITTGQSSETSSPDENVVGETSSSDEHVEGETPSPEEHVVGETSSPNEHVAGETSSPEEHVVGETFPDEHVVGETSSLDEHVVGETSSTDEHVVGETSGAARFEPDESISEHSEDESTSGSISRGEQTFERTQDNPQTERTPRDVHDQVSTQPAEMCDS